MSGSPAIPEKGKWAVERPEGYFDAIQATGTMVAPIMAGFAFAILALVLVPPGKNEADALRWRDPVLALLVAAALLLIISTQAAILARATLVKPGELMAWYPSSVEEDGKPDSSIREYQQQLQTRTARASEVCRQTYNAGALLFFTSIAVLLVPPSPVDSARRTVIVLALAAVSIEAGWLTGSSLRSKQRTGRLPVVLTPATYAIMAFVIVRFNTPAYALQATAAAGIAIAGVAATTASVRLAAKGNHIWLQAVGIAIAAASINAALAAVLLQTHWRHAVLDTEIAAVTLVVLLAATVFPSQTLKAPSRS